MNDKLPPARSEFEVICPDCGEEVTADVEVADWLDRAVDLRGEDPILIDHLEITLKVDCPKCGTNIFQATSGPLFFEWVGP